MKFNANKVHISRKTIAIGSNCIVFWRSLFDSCFRLCINVGFPAKIMHICFFFLYRYNSKDSGNTLDGKTKWSEFISRVSHHWCSHVGIISVRKLACLNLTSIQENMWNLASVNYLNVLIHFKKTSPFLYNASINYIFYLWYCNGGFSYVSC